MARLIPTTAPKQYRLDVLKLIKACTDNGHTITPADAIKVWKNFSRDKDYGWHPIPPNETELFEIIKDYTEEDIPRP